VVLYAERKTVEDYKYADFYERIILFLTYRDLREEFMGIEVHDHQNRVTEDKGSDGRRRA
jgi:hypothetical protein